MALPAGVARWTIEGTSNPEEVWAFDWWTSPGTGVASQAAWQSTVDALYTVLGTTSLLTNLASLIGTDGAITALRGLYYRNGQAAEFSGIHVASPAVAGTSSSRSPLQMCLCVTTLTGRPGASFRGRMYLPTPGMPLDTNHRFTVGSLTAVVNSLKQVMGAGTVDGQYGPPVVVSRTKGIATQITNLRYDLRPDIQRRRANRQATGARTTVTVP